MVARKKPEPIAKHVVCSMCGLDWKAHGPNPSTERCVELLKAELAKRPLTHWMSTGTPMFHANISATN